MKPMPQLISSGINLLTILDVETKVHFEDIYKDKMIAMTLEATI
jgi:hypothetical protein